MSKKLRKVGCTGTSWLRRIEEIFWGRPVLPVVLMVMLQVAERESGERVKQMFIVFISFN